MNSCIFLLAIFSSSSQADTNISGGLEREAVRKVIFSHKSEIKRCFEDALESNPNAQQGRIRYQWKIEPSGRVSAIEIKESDLKDSEVATCVSKIVLDMRFPEASNGLPTQIIFPFVFKKN
jgi:hypothetical protein